MTDLRSEALEAAAEAILGLLNMRTRRHSIVRRVERPIGYFSPVEPMVLLGGFEVANTSERLIFADATFGDIDCELDVREIVPGSTGDDCYTVRRTRRVTHRAARGRVVRHTRYVVESAVGVLSLDGSFGSDYCYVGSNDGVRWGLVSPWGLPYAADGPDGPVSWDVFMSLSCGLQFSRNMEWSVELRREGEPCAVSVVTDPVGVREVFRLRDIPEGASRRAALRNWVRAHWRQRHDDPSALVEVRRHMRGATSFTWGDMVCTIRPSRDDQETNERLKTERASRRKRRRRKR